jgi:hypothetical protein
MPLQQSFGDPYLKTAALFPPILLHGRCDVITRGKKLKIKESEFSLKESFLILPIKPRGLFKFGSSNSMNVLNIR